LKRRDRYRLR